MADRDAFLQAQSGLIERPASCLPGGSFEADDLPTRRDALRPPVDERLRENDVRYRRWGLRLLLINVACLTGLVALVAARGP